MNPKRLSLCALLTLITLGAFPNAKGAPKEDSPPVLPGKYAKSYLIAEGTTSPNKKFAVMYPTLDASESRDAGDYLVSLNPFEILAKVDTKWPHFQNRSNSGISVAWSSDSSVALVTLDSKWGPGEIFLFEVDGNKVKRSTNLLGKIYGLLTPSYRKSKAPPLNDVVDFIFESDGKPIIKLVGNKKVLIDGKATTDPKGLDAAHSWHGRIRAVWDIPEAQFTSQK